MRCAFLHNIFMEHVAMHIAREEGRMEYDALHLESHGKRQDIWTHIECDGIHIIYARCSKAARQRSGMAWYAPAYAWHAHNRIHT